MPSISVIVPVYKVEAYLRRCVDSILRQTFTDFDLILIDDGSPDNCGEICDEYAAKDSRVHVIHQENGGLSAARNAGIDWASANSDSQWLTFIDSDDWVHCDYLKVLHMPVQTKHIDISVCDYLATNTTLMEVATDTSQSILVDAEVAFTNYYGMCMMAWCKLFRKSLFEGIRFPPGKLYEDAYVSHLLVFASEKIAICESKLYYYYSNQESITRSMWTVGRLDEIEAHELRLTYLKENGFENAYKREVQATIYALHNQVLALAWCDSNLNQYKRLIMKRLRKDILHYKKNHMFDLENNYHIFETAFPHIMKAYWYWQVVLRKLHINHASL